MNMKNSIFLLKLGFLFLLIMIGNSACRKSDILDKPKNENELPLLNKDFFLLIAAPMLL